MSDVINLVEEIPLSQNSFQWLLLQIIISGKKKQKKLNYSVFKI